MVIDRKKVEFVENGHSQKDVEFERLKLSYAIVPNKVKRLFKAMGYEVKSLNDLKTFVDSKINQGFDFNKLLENIPVTAYDIKRAKELGIEIK